MKRVHVIADPVQAGFIQGVLESEGIPTFLRNAWLGGAAGELPSQECWPEIWVDDGDHARALELIAALEQGTTGDAPAWRCPRCGERIEPQFDRCWNCGFETD